MAEAVCSMLAWAQPDCVGCIWPHARAKTRKDSRFLRRAALATALLHVARMPPPVPKRRHDSRRHLLRSIGPEIGRIVISIAMRRRQAAASTPIFVLVANAVST